MSRRKLTTPEFIVKAEAVHGKYYGYDEVDYKGTVEKITIICPEHGGFHQTPNDHLKGKGCPICCKYGYRPNKPGNFYVQKLFKNNDLYAIKFGITNKIVESRMKQQNSKSCFTHKLFEELYFEDGNIPLEIEKKIKKRLSGKIGYVSKTQMEDGFTETVAPEHLSTIMFIAKNFQISGIAA